MTDVAHLILNTDQVRRTIVDAAERGLHKGGKIVLDESNRHVPYEEGDLEESGRVTQDGLEVAISYDGKNAVVQHEHLQLHHDPGRHAKFLEKAGAAKRREVEQAIADEIRRALGL